MADGGACPESGDIIPELVDDNLVDVEWKTSVHALIEDIVMTEI